MIHDRFDKEQYQVFLLKLLSICFIVSVLRLCTFASFTIRLVTFFGIAQNSNIALNDIDIDIDLNCVTYILAAG